MLTQRAKLFLLFQLKVNEKNINLYISCHPVCFYVCVFLQICVNISPRNPRNPTQCYMRSICRTSSWCRYYQSTGVLLADRHFTNILQCGSPRHEYLPDLAIYFVCVFVTFYYYFFFHVLFDNSPTYKYTCTSSLNCLVNANSNHMSALLNLSSLLSVWGLTLLGCYGSFASFGCFLSISFQRIYSSPKENTKCAYVCVVVVIVFIISFLHSYFSFGDFMLSLLLPAVACSRLGYTNFIGRLRLRFLVITRLVQGVVEGGWGWGGGLAERSCLYGASCVGVCVCIW